MIDLLTIENIGSLLILIFLQAVLGFDNLLYISIESQRAPQHTQKRVRFWGIIIAVALRVILLFVMIHLIEKLKTPFHVFKINGIIEGGINFASIIFLFGGIFIIYTAVKEINHLLSKEHLGVSNSEENKKSAFQVVLLIVFMNLIFSFDSILSAIAITEVLTLLIIAIITSGVAMLVLADKVTEFLERNRMYEVLGLFILLIVGIVLLGESGTAAAHAMHDQTLQIRIFDYPLIPMSKSTFYFSVIVLFLVEIIQTQYQRRLNTKHKNK
jgi:predicted tellurium resistance membrane protein TerC